MQYRKFGGLDWDVSEIGFGAWAIGGDMWGPQDDQESVKALHKAIDLGVNFIDTALGYGKGHSEEVIGNVLQSRTENLFVATKVPPIPGCPWPVPDDYDINDAYPADHIIGECEKSLKRLKRDYVDIYQFHTRTPSFNIEDGWFAAMQKLKADGKIRAIGVSVHDTTPDAVIGSLINERVESIQVIYNIFEQYPRKNLLPVCKKMGVAVIVRVPFDEGALTGKFTEETKFAEGDVRQHYFRGNNLSAVIDRVNQIDKFKEINHPGMPIAEYALRFCLSDLAVSTVIPGIRNIRQAELNTAASDGKLFDMTELEQLKQFNWRKDFWNEEV